MKLRGFFITGTDTGVGKTAVTAALCCLMNGSGRRAAPVKPVQTGVAPGEPGDLDIALAAAGLSVSPGTRRLLNPYCFSLPASPHLAAEQAGNAIDPAFIINTCRKLSAAWDYLLVEGAGGLRVPLTRSYGTLDLACALGLPVIVVARCGLGTLNHTLLTVDSLRAAGPDLAAVILNHTQPESAADGTGALIERDNRRVIGEIGRCPVFGPLPYVPGAGGTVEGSRQLARCLQEAGVDKIFPR